MITAAQLIAHLQQFPGDTPVLIPQGRADYWGRVPLADPDLDRDVSAVQYSDYHRAPIESRDEAGTPTVIL